MEEKDAGVITNLVQDLADLLRDPNEPVAFFVGAGVSTNEPSSLPLAKELIGWTIDSLWRVARSEGIRGLSGKAAISLKSLRPEVVFYELLSELGPNALGPLRVFGSGQPNKTHHFLASVLAKGMITTIVTTNFDRLLEKAWMSQRGTSASVPDLRVLKAPPDFDSCSLDNHEWPPTLLKLHGSCERRSVRNLQIAISHVGRPFGTERTSVLRHVLESHFVLVMGYSGADEFDILPILMDVRWAKGILWLDHSESKDLRVRRLGSGHAQVDRMLTGRRKAQLIQGRTAELVERLAKELSLGLPSGRTRHRREAIRERYRAQFFETWADDLPSAEAVAGLAALFRRVKDTSLASRLYQAAVDMTSATDHKARLHYLRRKGWTLHDGGSFREAAACFQQAESLAEERGDDLEEARVARDRAWPLKILAERGARSGFHLAKAEECLRRSEGLLNDLLRQRGQPRKALRQELARTTRDLAWVFVARQMLDGAIDLLRTAFDLYHRCRNEGEAAWTLRDLAAVLRQRRKRGDLEEAVKRLEDAEGRFLSAGDVYNVNWTLRDKGLTLYGMGKRKDGLQAIKESHERATAAVDYFNAGVSLGDYAVKCLDHRYRKARALLAEAITSLEGVGYSDKAAAYRSFLQVLERL